MVSKCFWLIARHEVKNEIENIKLHFICDQKWETFGTCGENKFCSKCSKKIVDFSNKTKSDFEKELLKSNGEICGKFAIHQTAYKKSNLLSKAFSGLLLTLGINLFTNEIKAQTAPDTNSTNHSTSDPSENYLLGVVISPTPIFKDGGSEGMKKFIQENIKSPKNLRSDGMVYVSFTVDKHGNVKDAIIKKGLSKEADAEALRVVNLMKFTTENYYGVTETQMELPISFTAPENEKKR